MPITLILGLIFIPSNLVFAIDDEDDTFGKVNSTRRSSVIDYGYGQQKNNSSSQRQNPVIDLGGFKKTDRLDSTIHVQPISQPKLETIQQSIDRQNRELEDFTARSRRLQAEQDKQWKKQCKDQKERNNEFEDRQWRNVETVAGAFVAAGPYYKGGNKMVLTDKGLVYSVGRDGVVGPDGYYFRSGDFWVGPNGKGGSVSGSGNNEFIAGGSQGSAIGLDRGFVTSRGYSWPSYPDPTYRGVSSTMRRP